MNVYLHSSQQVLSQPHDLRNYTDSMRMEAYQFEAIWEGRFSIAAGEGKHRQQLLQLNFDKNICKSSLKKCSLKENKER